VEPANTTGDLRRLNQYSLASKKNASPFSLEAAMPDEF